MRPWTVDRETIRTLKFSLNRAARWYPEREAWVQGFADAERRYTYAEANAVTRRVANGLAGLGIEPGDRVALLSTTTVEAAIAHYACTKLGAVPAAVHGSEAADAIAELIDRIRATALVFHPTYAETVETIAPTLEHTEELLHFDTLGEGVAGSTGVFDLAGGEAAAEPDVWVEADDVALLTFTSGTTGEPKPLVVRHEQMNQMKFLGAGASSERHRVLNATAPSFIGWESRTLATTDAGATTVFFDGEITRVPALIEAESLTHVGLTTTPWRFIVESGTLDDHDLSSVEAAMWSGEPMDPELYRTLREAVTEQFAAFYGSAETFGSGTKLRPHDIDERTIESVGKPRTNVELRLVEPGSRDPAATVGDGEVGEVALIGLTVCTEVWEDPAATAETFHEDGWVFTGDLGYLEDGFLYLVGRQDNLIISGGVNIHAERVERVLEEHPGVAEVAVVGTPHDRWGEAVKAYVRARNDALTADDLDAWCRERDDLADFQRPREYAFVEAFPRTDAGKVDRSAISGREHDAGPDE